MSALNNPDAGHSRHAGWLHVLLLALALAPYFIRLGEPGLWDSNEAFYAETPREMLESGDYVIPRFNYYMRWQKPPLTYWGVALSYRVFGVSEWAERLPIALAAAAWVLLCYWAGRRWFSPGTGLLAAVMLAGNFRVFVMSQRAITEIWLPVFLSAALLLAAAALFEVHRRPGLLLALAYALLGLATLTKGPVAPVLTGFVALAHAAWVRRPGWFRELRPWLAVAILGATVLPWYLAVAGVVGWEPAWNFLLSDNIGRYTSEEFGPLRGPQYYLLVLLGDFFPWSLLAVAAVIGTPWRRRQAERRPDDAEAPPLYASVRRWLLVWVLAVLVFFSLSRNKQEYYVLPLYLPLCLLLADWLMGLSTLSGWRRQLARVLFLLAGVVFLAAGPLAAVVLPNLFPQMPALQVAAVAVILSGGGLLICLASWRGGWALCRPATLWMGWSVTALLALFLIPQWEQYRPVRDLARRIQSERVPGDYAGYYKYSAPSLAFYMREPIFEMIWEEEAVYLLSTTPRRIFCVLREEDFERIRPRLRQRYRILDARPLPRIRAATLLVRPMDLGQMPRLLLISNAP